MTSAPSRRPPVRPRGSISGLLGVGAALLIGLGLFALVLAHRTADLGPPVPSTPQGQTQMPAMEPPATPRAVPGAPKGGSNCVARPSACHFADETTTGVTPGTALRRVPEDVTQGTGWHWDTRGYVTIDGDGANFSGYSIATGVVIYANNVTVRNNEITASDGGWGISLRHSLNATLDHNTIKGAANSPCDNGIRDIYGDADNVAITSNNIYYCSSGINHLDTGGVIRGNYIHDIGHDCPGDDVNCGHFNGIQLGSGNGPSMTIDGNTILIPYPSTDAIMLANDDGPQTNRTITGNLIGGGGYAFYGSGGPAGQATNITVSGNQFTTIYYPQSGSLGPVAHWQNATGNTWTNNTWADGPQAGTPVNPS